LTGDTPCSHIQAHVTGTNVTAYIQDVHIPVEQGSLVGFSNHTMAITTGIANEWHIGLNALVPLSSSERSRVDFRVKAVIGDPTGMTGDILFSSNGLGDLFPDAAPRIGLILLRTPQTSTNALGAIQTALREFPQVTIQSKASFVASQNHQFQQLINIVLALLGLAVAIALFGIVNTLALSILERHREIGLLRALGLSRRQLRASIQVEAIIMSLVGAVLGVGLGILFGWAVVDALGSDGVNLFSIPVVELVIFVLLSGLAGIAASVLPARSAARVDILTAITIE
jgi:putative ABC transport system permease protein